MAPKTGITALKPNGYSEKNQVLLPKIDIISRKIHLLSIDSKLLPQKTHCYPKKHIVTKKSRLSQQKKKSHCYQKNHRITQKKHIITKPPGILMEKLEIVIIKPDIIT